MSTDINSYRHIGSSAIENYSHRVVLKNNTPVIKGRMGRFLIFLGEMFQSSKKCKLKNDKVKDHFMKVISENFNPDAASNARQDLNSIKTGSLRARDVHAILRRAYETVVGKGISEDLKGFLCEDSAKKLLAIMQHSASLEFQLDNVLSDDEMAALILASGCVKIDEIGQKDLINALETDGQPLSKLASHLQSALSKIPPFVGTVNTARELRTDEDEQLIADKDKEIAIPNKLLVLETLTPSYNAQFNTYKYDHEYIHCSYKSTNGRKLQFGTEEGSKEFLVFFRGAKIKETSAERFTFVSAGATESQKKELVATDGKNKYKGALLVNYEEIENNAEDLLTVSTNTVDTVLSTDSSKQIKMTS